MSLYEVLLFFHILAAAIWVGGSFALQVRAERAVRAWDHVAIQSVNADAEFLGIRVFFPASMVVLAAGIWLVIETSFGWTEPFVVVGLGIFVLSAITGMAFFSPETTKLKELIPAQGLDAPEVKARIKRITMMSRIDVTLLVIAIFFMATKPGA